MPRARPSSRKPRATVAASYWEISRRPLQILVFLLPLVITYELALPGLITSRGRDVKAHRGMVQFFETFGITSGALYLGGAAIIVVLLMWHLMERRTWKVDLGACALMAAESLLLIIPLLVLKRLIGQVELAALLSTTPGSAGLPEYATWSTWEKITLSIGAGLYEELLFRMLLIAVLHTLLVDVGKASNAVGGTIAVVVSAAAFTWYHPLAGPEGQVVLDKLVFLFLAGVYFGGIYVVRGFGIVVAVHALYDILTLSWQA